jgi:leucyl/phenylalanyl-tRNA--protein transferase
MSRRGPCLLDGRVWFPAVTEALPSGLLAVGGDLGVERLLLAYRSGIFPWEEEPVTWWAPDPRAVFEPGGLRVSRSLARVMRSGRFEVTVDRAFDEVMRACGERREGTWITGGFLEAYGRLHAMGHAHSVECWRGGELVGGVFGVAVGGLFAGESMFHRATDAGKVALVRLLERVWGSGMTLFDTQMLTGVTAALGAVEIRRAEYMRRLRLALASGAGWG